MAYFGKCSAIGYHMFIYQEEMRLRRHRILQLKSKLNLTSQLIRKNARDINKTDEDNITTFHREVQFKTQLEQELCALNYNELRPKETYFPGQLRPKTNIMPRVVAENMRRHQISGYRLQRKPLNIKIYKKGQECGGNATQLTTKQRTPTESKPDYQNSKLQFPSCSRNIGREKNVKRRLEFGEQEQPLPKRYRQL